MDTEEIVIGDKKYTVASMRTGQLRDLHNMRLVKPDRNFMEDNIYTVATCLMNGEREMGKPVADLSYYTEVVEGLPCRTFNVLLEASNRISGFIVEKKKLGESTATE